MPGVHGRGTLDEDPCGLPFRLVRKRVAMATATQRPTVRRVRAEHLAPLIGIAPMLLGLAGLIVLEGPADRPELDAPPAVILSYSVTGTP
jgi:hypothetical protein